MIYNIPNSENGLTTIDYFKGNPLIVEIHWEKGIINSIVIYPNEFPEYLSANNQYNRLGYPDEIYLQGPYNNWMGFILNFQKYGYAFSIISEISNSTTVCFDVSLRKEIILELYDPQSPVDIQDQVDIFGELIWKTQADPGYSIEEITNRIISEKCISYKDFTNLW